MWLILCYFSVQYVCRKSSTGVFNVIVTEDDAKFVKLAVKDQSAGTCVDADKTDGLKLEFVPTDCGLTVSVRKKKQISILFGYFTSRVQNML